MKKTILFALALFVATAAFSQADSDTPTGTLSPYSQFGIGLLANPNTGYNAAMEGLSIGMRSNNHVNPQNPASYSAIDSLTFIFDAGGYMQFSNYKQGNKKLNRTTGDFDYVAALFRATKGVGVSFGLQPISQVGYDYSESSTADGVTSTTSYHARHGGLQKYFLGVGYLLPFKSNSFSLSAGINASYIHGEINRNVSSSNSDSYSTSYSKVYNAKFSSFGLDAGIQGQMKLNKKDVVTLGATYAFGHSLGTDLNLTSTTSTEGSKPFVAEDAFSLPTSYGVGVSYAHGSKWLVGFDYSAQLWKSVDYPEFTGNENGFVMQKDYYKNRHRFVLGGEYCLNSESHNNFFDRIRYRGGVSYTTPYCNVGPKEMAASIGLAFPIINGYNNRSILNIAAEWVKSDNNVLVKENSFRIKLGLTFNERWFMKWKVE